MLMQERLNADVLGYTLTFDDGRCVFLFVPKAKCKQFATSKYRIITQRYGPRYNTRRWELRFTRVYVLKPFPIGMSSSTPWGCFNDRPLYTYIHTHIYIVYIFVYTCVQRIHPAFRHVIIILRLCAVCFTRYFRQCLLRYNPSHRTHQTLFCGYIGTPRFHKTSHGEQNRSASN